jgi:hypothetical protein
MRPGEGLAEVGHLVEDMNGMKYLLLLIVVVVASVVVVVCLCLN